MAKNNKIGILNPNVINKITKGPYYHLKLSNYQSGQINTYEADSKKILKDAKEKLKEDIEEQKKKELGKLELAFPKNLKTANINYKNLINAKTVEEKLEILNSLIQKQSVNFGGLTTAVENTIIIIREIFGNEEFSGSFNVEGITEELLENLKNILKKLEEEFRKAEKTGDIFLTDVLQRPITKLSSAITYFSSELKKNIEDKEVINIIQNFLGNKNKWSSDTTKKSRSLSSVKTVLERSAYGYGSKQKGDMYEIYGVQTIENILGNILDEDSFKVEKTGRKKNSNKKQQKADITISFTFNEKSNSDLKLSVKYSSPNTNTIQIHHGGSLFSFIDKYKNYNSDISNIIDNGNFQYHYVNSLRGNKVDNKYMKILLNFLESYGYYFLGLDLGKNPDFVDFMYKDGRIISLSSILQKIYDSSENMIKIKIDQTKFNALNEKRKEMKTSFRRPPSEYYKDDFIEMSKDVGKRAITGTRFTLDLSTSAFNE